MSKLNSNNPINDLCQAVCGIKWAVLDGGSSGLLGPGYAGVQNARVAKVRALDRGL